MKEQRQEEREGLGSSYYYNLDLKAGYMSQFKMRIFIKMLAYGYLFFFFKVYLILLLFIFMCMCILPACM